MSSLLGKFWLTAAREACSMSRIHLLMLSMDESHSRWPGALSLRGKMKPDETAKNRKKSSRIVLCRGGNREAFIINA